MTAYELHDLLVDHRALIMNTWQFFVSVHLAMLGLAFVVRFHEPKWFMRVLMLVGYAGFMFINYNAQLDNYKYATALLDYLQAIDTPAMIEPERALHSVFRKGWILQYLLPIYGACLILGILAIFLPAFGTKTPREEQRDASVLVM
jgi:hypothetical protein